MDLANHRSDMQSKNTSQPTVSICCQTFNHAGFLKQCLESFLMQKTTFAFEVLIHDDASTDGTVNIIKEFAEKYPAIIKPLYQTENQYSKGIKPLTIFNLPRAKGTYIALCEGDDYWTDPYKLQKQVDILEAHKEYSASFHETEQRLEDGSKGKIYGKDAPDILTTEDTFSTVSPFHTSSIVFRNILGELPEWYKKVFSSDMALFSILSSFGPLKKIPEIMSVYRKHEHGITSRPEVIRRHNYTRIELMNYLDEFHHHRFHEKAVSVVNIHKQLIEAENQKNESVLAIVCPQVGAVSETFIKKHIEKIAPSRTVILTGKVMDESWVTGPLKIIPIQLGAYTFSKEQETDVAQFLKEHHVTHILCEFGCIGGAVVDLNYRELHLPIYIHFHGQDSSEFIRNPEIVKYYRRMGSVVDGVIAVSIPMAERLVNVGIPKEKIKVIHSGVDYPEVNKTTPEKNPCRFIFVARLVGKKGILFVLQAFEKAKKQVPGISLDIIGDGPLRSEVEIFIAKNHLGDSVILHGEKPHQFVLEMMNTSSVFLQHSIVDQETGSREGLPVSTLEASAHGLPVISTFHEGIPEAVEHEKTGLLVEEQDWKKMAEYIVTLAHDAQLRKKMGEAGREKILKDGFTTEAMVKQLRDFIRLKINTNRENIKRVLFVNHSVYPYESSGTPISTLNHALGMHERGLDVAVLIPSADLKSGYDKQQKDEFILYRLPRMEKYQAFFGDIERDTMAEYLDSVKHIILDFAPDVVHINDYVFMPEDIISLFSKSGAYVIRNVCNLEELCHMDSPVYFDGQKDILCSGPDSPEKCAECYLRNILGKQQDEMNLAEVTPYAEKISRRFESITSLYKDNVDGVVFTEKTFKEYFKRFVDISDEQIAINPRGFHFSAPRILEYRKKHSNVVHIGFLGDLGPRKGIALVLKAFEQLCHRENFVLDIYASKTMPFYLQMVKKLEERYPDKIKFYGGYDQSEFARIAESLDVALVPSSFETFNRVVRELLYFGVPIIATDFFGSSIVNDGVNGIKINVGDSDAFAHAIETLLVNPSFIEELSKGAMATPIETLDDENEGIYHFYKKTIRKKGTKIQEPSGLTREIERLIEKQKVIGIKNENRKPHLSSLVKLSEGHIKRQNNFEAYLLLQKILKEDATHESARQYMHVLEDQIFEKRIAKKWSIQKSKDALLEAEASIERQDLPDAKRKLYEILNLEPKNIDALNDLSVVSIMGNNTTYAEDLVSIILRNEPDNEIALDNLAYLRRKAS